MTRTTLYNHPPLDMPVEVHGYDINLELQSDGATLTLAGDLDAAATDALRRLLTVVQLTPSVMSVHAEGVLGADLDAFDPLFEAARARRARGLPSIRVESLGDAVRDLFGVLGVQEQQLPVVL
jgi:ABC-type transporter Mla MlaB component